MRARALQGAGNRLEALLTRRVGAVRAGRIMGEARDQIRAGLIRTIEILRPE